MKAFLSIIYMWYLKKKHLHIVAFIDWLVGPVNSNPECYTGGSIPTVLY